MTGLTTAVWMEKGRQFPGKMGREGWGCSYRTHKLIDVSKRERQNKNKNPVSVTSFIISFLPYKMVIYTRLITGIPHFIALHRYCIFYKAKVCENPT